MIDEFLILLFLIIFYVTCLILLKTLDIGKKVQCENCTNCCPNCSKPLTRIKRTLMDHTLIYLAFTLFNFKRYKCQACTWEGLRWEKRFESQY